MNNILEEKSMSLLPKFTQVLIVGGGPAGTTAATLLAREGFDVTLLEREIFPRYHIGESLLPSSLQVLDLLGVREKVEAYGFQSKPGAHYIWGDERWDVNFSDLEGNYTHSFQVRRDEFDKLLLDHAKSQGVKVFEGIEVNSLSFNGDRPQSASWSQRVEGNSTGELSFDFLIDATGRSGLMATNYLKNREYHEIFQNVAIWGYWKNATRLGNGREGAILVNSTEDGWLWGIPLHDGTMNVGLVIHKKTFKEKRSTSLENIYLEGIAKSSTVKELLEPAELVSKVRVEQDYSYTADRFAGSGYLLAGDAACFLDPLLSTGVHLATFSGLLAAASLASVLRNEIKEDEAMSFYERNYKQAYLRLMVMVSAFYDQNKKKESYFWEAQQLTTGNYSDRDKLQQMFVNLTSGMEDMLDVEEKPDQIFKDVSSRLKELWDLRHKQYSNTLKEEEHEQMAASHEFFTAFNGIFSLSKEAAIDGFYLVTTPQIGLAHANA